MSINFAEMIKKYRENEIYIEVKEGNLLIRKRAGTLTEEQKEFLKLHKEEIVAALEAGGAEKRFPLTDIQAAYFLGRMGGFSYGGISCQVSFEILYDGLELARANEVFREIIQKHEMLRAVIHADGRQEILDAVPEFSLKFQDCSEENYETSNRIEDIRKEYADWQSEIGQWPFFNFGITKFADQTVLHLTMDFMIADWTSIWILVAEFEQGYFDGKLAKTAEVPSFRDYLKLEEAFLQTKKYKMDKKYWQEHIHTLSAAPQLPICEERIKGGFHRRVFHMDTASWETFQNTAKQNQCTATVAVLTAYGMTLAMWGRSQRFGLNLTMLNRMPLTEGIEEIVGDFTTVSILDAELSLTENFQSNMRRMQQQMSEVLDHASYSGVKVMHDITREQGSKQALYPYVFTGSIGLIKNQEMQGRISRYGISQTPQVFIDCQAMDSAEGLRINWDIRDGIFAPEVEAVMFHYFCEMLTALSKTPEAWLVAEWYRIPKAQEEVRQRVNHTECELPFCPLHKRVAQMASAFPQHLAVADGDGELSYEQMWKLVTFVAVRLQEHGIQKGDRVGILLPKGRYQVIAVLAVLSVGGIYVPLDEKQPINRIRLILKKAEVREIISDKKLGQGEFFVPVFDISGVIASDQTFSEVDVTAQDLAYIIFTSGSTGVPKGVEVTHGAADNTIQDINAKFQIQERDRILGLSRLNFDLSVYDMFGLLSMGGAVIYPTETGYLDALHWIELMERYQITIWNTVPALFQMLLDVMGETMGAQLRVILLSGDWIPVALGKRVRMSFPYAKLIGLGGATEGAIWSNYHIVTEYDDARSSIPYGKPLANQSYRVVDEQLLDCPDYVIGELCILGRGVAHGYCGEPEMTRAQFVCNEAGARMYRTGDYGYYERDGTIVFCGRRDSQIKIHGHRIEIGEIEAVLSAHASVDQCKVMRSPLESNTLVAVVLSKEEFDEAALKHHIEEHLPEYMVPAYIMSMERFPLSQNGKIDQNALQEIVKERLGEAKVEEIVSESELETALLQIFEQHLAVSGLPLGGNVYDYGADSLVLARIISDVRGLLKKEKPDWELSFDGLLRQILNRPTVHQLYKFIHETWEEQALVTDQKESGNKRMGLFTLYGDQSEGIARVIFHAGLGTMNCFRYFIPELVKQQRGSVYGVTIQNMETYCRQSSETLVEERGREYAQTIVELGIREVQLIGYCMGGLIALETARELARTEVEIKDFLLVDSAPVFYDIGESIALELMFITNYFITVEDVYPEITNEELMGAIMYVFANSGNRLHEEDFEILAEASTYEAAYQFLEKLKKIPEEQRFGDYADTIARKANREVPAEMLLANFRLYIHSFQASRVDAEPYFGDIHFLQAAEPLDFIFTKPEDMKAYWTERVVGDICWTPVPGNHITCIEDERNAKIIAEHAGKNLEE